jgi:WD40 repeat protein
LAFFQCPAKIIHKLDLIFVLYSGLEDGSIAIWSPLGKTEQSRHRILSICAENDVIVDSLSFSQDGRLLASLVRDNDGNQLITWSTQVYRKKWIEITRSVILFIQLF